MRSTGEVMGISERFSIAFAKSQLAAGVVLPREGTIFVSVTDRHKDALVDLARKLVELGFELVATERHGQAFGGAWHPGRAACGSCKKGIPTCSTT